MDDIFVSDPSPADEQFIAALILRLMAFRRNLKTRRPPDLQEPVADAQALLRLHPDDNGKGIALPEEYLAIADRFEKFKALEKKFGKKP